MRASFVFSEVNAGLRRNVTMTIAMILTTAISLGMFGGGLLFVRTIDKMQANFLDDVEEVLPEHVGGQRAALDTVLSVLTGVLVNPDLARNYRLNGAQSLLMEGAPGTGKTLMAKAAAAMVRRLTGRRCRFAVVKPGEWLSQWVGGTEDRIRETFRALSEAAGPP